MDGRIQRDVLAYLPLEASMNARKSEGGTATVRTLEQLEAISDWLGQRKS